VVFICRVGVKNGRRETEVSYGCPPLTTIPTGIWKCPRAYVTPPNPWGRGDMGPRAFPNPSWDGGEGWDEADHMPSCVTYVTKEHFMFVKRALQYLAVSIVRGRGWRGTCGEGRRRGYQWVGGSLGGVEPSN